ncbi:MAG: hypothetical protein R6T92_06090 [Desulfosalsimonadaceae bacterium]
MLDVSVAYNRYKFLGHEFLTWLWYKIETDPDILTKADPELASLAIGNRVVLENSRHNREETITIRGDGAGLEEGLIALKKGGKVTEVNLVYCTAEYEWRFNLKGESLALSSLKTPHTGKVEKKEDLEGAVLERIYLVEKIVSLTYTLYTYFIAARLSDDWDRRTVFRINKWIDSAIAGN